MSEDSNLEAVVRHQADRILDLEAQLRKADKAEAERAASKETKEDPRIAQLVALGRNARVGTPGASSKYSALKQTLVAEGIELPADLSRRIARTDKDDEVIETFRRELKDEGLVRLAFLGRQARKSHRESDREAYVAMREKLRDAGVELPANLSALITAD